MSGKTHVVLMEYLEGEEMRELAVGLAGRGDSIGIVWRGADASEDSIDKLQLLLERTGGISCAFKIEETGPGAVESVIRKMIDLFGRVDELICFTESMAKAAAGTIAKIPLKHRPKLITGSEFNV